MAMNPIMCCRNVYRYPQNFPVSAKPTSVVTPTDYSTSMLRPHMCMNVKTLLQYRRVNGSRKDRLVQTSLFLVAYLSLVFMTSTVPLLITIH